MKTPRNSADWFSRYAASKGSPPGEDIWWHGDASKRSSFHDQKMDYDGYEHERNANGPGIYFTRLKDQAIGYAGEGRGWVYGVRFPGGRFFKDKTKPTVRFVHDLIRLADQESLMYGLSDWDENPSLAMRKAVASYSAQDTLLDAALGVKNNFYSSSNEWTKAMVKLGWDGFLHKLPSTEHMIVYNPDVIQIVSEETYDEAKKKWLEQG
jgi:hypothetical protein